MSVENARQALREYVEKLLSDRSPEGEEMREALFGARDGERIESVRSRLLRETELWGPGAPEWRALQAAAGGTIYSGRLLQLRTEVRADRNGRISEATVFLD